MNVLTLLREPQIKFTGMYLEAAKYSEEFLARFGSLHLSESTRHKVLDLKWHGTLEMLTWR